MDHCEVGKKQVVDRYLCGELPPSEQAEFEEHFFSCIQCSEELNTHVIFAKNAQAVFREQSNGVEPVEACVRWTSVRQQAGASDILISMKLMKAALLRDFGQPLAIEEVGTPVPVSGEILIRVEACGVCHSDLHLAEGNWKQLKSIVKFPLILGHEVVGSVVEIGDQVDEFSKGDRVGVPWLHFTCGKCEYCQIGRETLCTTQLITGCSVDGGFAEFIRAKASHAVKLPASLSSREAAPLLCAGLTVYKALKSSGVRAGERLALFGIGGLGHLAVQVAKRMGVKVCAIDVCGDKLQLATDCGADWTVNAGERNAQKEIRSLGGAHVALVTASTSAPYETALRSLKPGGTLVVVGMGAEPINVSTVAMVSGEIRIIGSAVGTRQDLREMLELAAEGGVRCTTSRCALEDLNDVLKEMKNGRLTGRAVVEIA